MRAIKQIKKATATPKGKIIFFSILLLIIAAIGGGILYWQYNKKWIIRNELEAAVKRSSKGLYKISYDKLELDEVTGFLSVTNMRLEYDSLKYASLIKQDLAPPSLFKIHIPSIAVYGVKTPRALIDKEIDGRKIEIKNPVIDIMLTSTGKDSARHTPSKEVYEQILGNLNMISIDTVQISGAIITTSDFKTKKQNIGLYHVFIELNNVIVDSAANEDKTRILFSKSISLSCDSLFWKSDNNMYKYGADSVVLNSATNVVHIDKFYVQPQLAEDAFVNSLPTQDDRFDFSMKDISLRNINFLKLVDEDVIADSVIITSASFKVYRDLAIKRDKKNRVGTYPHQAVAKLPIPIEIKKVVLKHAFVEYKERSAKTRQAGKVQFYNSNAVITNLTNKKEKIAGDNVMTVDIHASFLNRTPINTTWLFYLNNPNGRFDIKGNLGSLDAKDLNELIIPMGPAKIEEGKINSLYFNLEGNDYSMNGNIKFLYDDLKVTILEKDEDTKKLDEKKLKSLVANLVVKNSNPSGKKDEARTVNVQNERNTNRSIFHLSWKTLFKGVKETVGINK